MPNNTPTFFTMMKYHFLPNHETVVSMVDSFRKKLQGSYRKLLMTIYAETGHKQSQAILEKMEALALKDFSSILTFYYHHTVETINKGRSDINKLLSDLDLVVSFVHHNNDQFVVHETMPTTISNAIVSAMENTITNYTISLRGLPQTKEAEARHHLEHGIEYLRHSCPKLLRNIQVLVNQVFFIGSDSPGKNYAFSLTSPVTQGMIFINGEYNPSWVFLLDKYIHESAHTYLFLINQEESLVLNDPKERYPSPLRQDMRPMEGVYHALFVLASLLYSFAMIIEKSELMERDKKEIITLMKMYLEGLEKSYTTVMKKGKLTPIARLLLEEGYDTVHQLQHVLYPIRRDLTTKNT